MPSRGRSFTPKVGLTSDIKTMCSTEAKPVPSSASTPPDVAALARRPADMAPLFSWQPLVIFKSLWRLFAVRPRALAAGLVAAVLRAAVLLFVSAAVGHVVSGGAPLVWVVMAAAGVIATAALGCLGQRWVIDAVQEGLTRLRTRLVEQQLALSVDTVQHHGPEGFVLAMTRDAELLSQMARACFGALLPGLILMVLCLVGVTMTLPALVVPLSVAMLLLWMARKGLARRLVIQMSLTHEAIDRLYEQLGGTVLRHETAVSHANEAQEREACLTSIAQTHALTRTLACAQSYASELDALVLGLALLGMVVWLITTGGKASGASLASVLFLLLALRGALQSVLRALQDVAQGVPALANVERLLALAVAPAHHGVVPPELWRMVLNGVSRCVDGHAVVDGVNLKLEPGRIAVLTGANGAGKTTLLRLLLGLAEADGGVMLVDGVPWPDIDREAFRQGVGYLPQNPVLFAGSVHENICYGARDVTPHALRDMVQAVGLETRLSRLSGGLAARLGAGGSPLSGGERQRVALARVLLREPRLLVLDEPTNHLDGPSSEALISMLRCLPNQPAVLIVSHDPVLIEQADEVLEMTAGRLRVLARPASHEAV